LSRFINLRHVPFLQSWFLYALSGFLYSRLWRTLQEADFWERIATQSIGRGVNFAPQQPVTHARNRSEQAGYRIPSPTSCTSVASVHYTAATGKPHQNANLDALDAVERHDKRRFAVSFANPF
jgi:hypothetical protein